MAIDHALLESVQQGGPPVLRLYRWDPACLSFGRNQRTAGVYDSERIRAAGLDVVRRPTGGLAVLHDRELTYCVLAPAAALGGPRRAYEVINRALVAGLASLGVHAVVATAGAAPHPHGDAAAPCFQAPAAGEVVAGGRKLVGSAQRREGGTLLQHGSILIEGSQDAVLALLHPPPAPDPGAAAPGAAAPGPGAAARAPGHGGGSVTLRELLGSVPPWQTLVDAVCGGFVRVCGTRLAPEALTPREEARAARHETFYAGAAWTWRR
jgi:lipoyl(octanoyl) transferase